jgi:hypothetical protein
MSSPKKARARALVIEADIALSFKRVKLSLSLNKVTHPILWGCSVGHIRPKGAIRALPKRVSDAITIPENDGVAAVV